MFSDIFENKYKLIATAALILVPYCTWRSLYNSYKSLKQEYEEQLLFHNRHNCVVMYMEQKGMSGWPPHKGRVKIDISKRDCLSVVLEPIMYFIFTAEKSLDVAFMIINLDSIYTALINAHRKGIKVRILLNFEHTNKLDEIEELMKEGIEVLTYVSQKPGMSSIMHYKFMIKDYTGFSGFLFTGSLNLSRTGFYSNYEDIVFTSNQYVVKSFHDNFVDCWNFVEAENEKLINKTILFDGTQENTFL